MIKSDLYIKTKKYKIFVQMTCRGICERYRAEKNRYQIGIKRCSFCDMYLQCQEISCPCCGTQLRTKRKSKLRLQNLKL